MLEPLYLDTARLGQMSPRACRASVDFARLASDQGCSLYFSQFLTKGSSVWPDSLRDQYPGLDAWQGIQALGQRFKQLAGASPSSEVVFAARSAELMRFAARLLSGPCRNVLLTDLTWPAYLHIFETERRGSDCRQTSVPLRQPILREQLSSDEVIERIATTYLANGCDGLFLPLVDNLGVALPIKAIVERVRKEALVRFVVVDGAQAIGHVPLNLAHGYCDLLIAGCHKWLRAFSPLGLAFFGMPGSQDYIRSALTRWVRAGSIDDPLFAFSQDLCGGDLKPYGETVQVGPLFTANAAAIDALERGTPKLSIQSRATISDIAENNGWRAVAPNQDMTSSILLFEPKSKQRFGQTQEELRSLFLDHGVALSSYPSGLIRVSLPQLPMRQHDINRLEVALHHAAKSPGGEFSASRCSYRPYFDDHCR